jgi:hypothetical protein
MRQATFRHARVLASGALAAAMLAGCAHKLDLIPLDGGRPGIGDVSFRGGGMKVYLDGKRYSGPFISATDPEIARVTAPAEAVAGPVTAGRYWGVQGKEGPTGAVLAAKDGASIACRFTYDNHSMLGAGLCRGDDGRNFSLRMQ